jgi:predicted deacylase
MNTKRNFLRSLNHTVLALSVFLLTATGSVATELIDEDELPKSSKVQSTEDARKLESIIPLEEKAEGKIPQEEFFNILDTSVPPGTFAQLSWPVELNSLKFDIPVIVAHGAFKGPVIGITAALHGDELNGIEIARQVLYGVNPEKLSGTMVAIPIVNIEGFVKQSRYMADRRDLNRYFPGDPEGVTPARFAHELFHKIILKCDALVDLHTGSYYRSNLPQLRADLTNNVVADMVTKFGALTVLHSAGSSGMLRNAASAVGIPAVTMEVGGPLALDLDDVAFGVKAVNTFLGEVGMIRRSRILTTPQPVFYESQWLMSDTSGILLADAKLGARIKKGEQIAKVVNPITNSVQAVKAPFAGKILGKAQNQFVSAGYIIFRIGIEKTEEQVIEDAQKDASAATEGSK